MTLDVTNQFSLVPLGYTPREPAISPFKPINRPLKTDWHNGTTYIEPMTLIKAYLIKPEDS